MARLSPELEANLRAWREQRLKIVFTNGVFDILHSGHLHQLRAAKAEGDVLIVGLNSDDSVRRLNKGTDRPINSERARENLLMELRCVDAVAVFKEDTPLELIEYIKPDVLVKGADYSDREVVGSDVVLASGGKVVLVPLLEGFSTTGLLERMRGGR